MQNELLLVLLEGADARRLRLMCSTWNIVGKKPPEEQLEAWARLCGMQQSDVERLAPRLLETSICLPGGALDRDALGVLNQTAAYLLERLTEDA